MAKNDNKTRPTSVNVDDFLDGIADDTKRADCHRLRTMMEEISGEAATLWGPSIVGFGSYHYRYDSGHEGDTAAVGFAPRSTSITLYITGGFDEIQDALTRLGKHKTGKGCLYIKRLADVDEAALTEIIRASLNNAAAFHVSAG